MRISVSSTVPRCAGPLGWLARRLLMSEDGGMVNLAIDGPGGAGKSTLAAALAVRLGWAWSGWTQVMYGALAPGALRAAMDPANPDAMSWHGRGAGRAFRRPVGNVGR
ncbi:MAG: (d)CMP kinase [Acidimicrobiales bacterium]